MGSDALVGRERELSVLAAAVDNARAGALQVVLIEGEAGIGKSKLAQATAEHARACGLATFVGSAEELERARPFRCVVEALDLRGGSTDPRRDEIVRLLAGGPHADPMPVGAVPELQYRLCDAVLELIEDESSRHPVLLVLEDLHWADAGTLLVLRAVARRVRHLPVMVLGTMRPPVAASDLDRVVDRLTADEATRLHLGRLEPTAVAELVGGMVGSTPSPAMIEWVEAAAGNPFYIVELVQSLLDEHALETTRGAHQLPPGLRLTILRRLSYLPRETLELLRLASILGASFPLSDLAAVMRREPASLVQHLDSAVRSGVVGERGDRLAFRHDLVREAIYQDVPADARRHLHRDAGRALADAGAPTDRVAVHMALGAETGDLQAVTWLRRAAAESAPNSLPIAIDLLERAVALVPPEDTTRTDVIAELLVRLVQAGRPTPATRLAEDLLRSSPPPHIESIARDAFAVALTQDRRFAEARDELAKLARASWAEAGVRAMALADMAHASMFLGEPETAQRYATEALDLGTEIANTKSICSASMALSLVAATCGLFDDAIGHAERAMSVVHDVRTPGTGYPVAELVLGLAQMDADRFDLAGASLASGIRYAEATGLASQVPVYHWALAGLHFFAGRWDDAIAEAESGLAHAEETGLLAGSLIPHALLGRVLLARDDVAGARVRVAAGEQELARSGPGVGGDLLLWTRALLQEIDGDPAGALATLDVVWGATAPIRYLHSYRTIAPDIVRLAVATSRFDLAERVVADVAEGARRSPTASACAADLRCRGLLKSDPELLRRSVEKYGAGPRPYDCAQASEDLGRVLATSHGRPEAVAAFEAAISGYEHAGAVHDVARVEASLRSLGVRRARRSRHVQAATGWDALTPTERRVAGLVAEGLTNPQIAGRMFLSPRTIQTHVAHILRKLGCTSRVALAAEVSRRGVSTAP